MWIQVHYTAQSVSYTHLGLGENTDEEKAVKESVDKVYKELADGKLTPILAEGGAGYDFCKAFSEKKMSKCLTLNGWFVDVK